MGLFERIPRPGQTIAIEGELPISSRYTVGLAGETFFRAIKDEAKFMATYCPDCDITYVPPRLYCEQCFAKLDEWVEVPTTGQVHTFTVVHVGLDEDPLEEPRFLAFVQLDDADGGLVHFLGELDPDEVYIGMPVEAVFKEAAERKGSILDIAYFRPL